MLDMLKESLKDAIVELTFKRDSTTNTMWKVEISSSLHEYVVGESRRSYIFHLERPHGSQTLMVRSF